MKKLVKLTLTVLIFAAIILAAPFGMGFLAEKEAHKKIKEVQLKLEQHPNIEYKLISYKRGFFKSEAEESVIFRSLKIDGKEVGPIELLIRDEIKHGPIVLSQDKSNKLDLWIGRAVVRGQLKKVVGVSVNPLPLDIYAAYVGFRGDVKLVMDISKLSLDFPTFTAIFEGFKDQLEISYDQKKCNNQLELKHALLTDKIKPQKFDLTGLNVTTDMTKDEKGLWLGARKIEADSLTAGLDGKNYVVKGLYNKTRDLEHDKQIKSEVMLSIRSAGVDNKFHGPHHLVLEVDGMDASILGSLNETFVKLGHENLNLVRAQGTPAQAPEISRNQALINKMGELAADLIKKGFSIEVKNLDIATNWGTLTANSRFKIPNLLGQQQQIPQLSLLTSILSMDSALNAKIPVGLAKAVVESRYRKMLESQNLPTQSEMQNVSDLADKHLAKLVADGWFIPKGNIYEISLSFKKGEFLVNNKPLKPQGILPELVPPAPAQTPAPVQGDDPQGTTPATVNPAADTGVQTNVPQDAKKEEEKSESKTSVPASPASPVSAVSSEQKAALSDIKPSPLSQTIEEAQSSAADKKPEPTTPAAEPVVKNPVAPVTPVPSTVRPQPQAQDNASASQDAVTQ